MLYTKLYAKIKSKHVQKILKITLFSEYETAIERNHQLLAGFLR